MGLFSNYEKVGPGISKNPEEKLPFVRFFELYFSHFSRLIMLNFLFILAFLPFAGIMLAEYYMEPSSYAYVILYYVLFVLTGIFVGPCVCGFTKVIRNISCERPIFLWHDFWKAFRQNFKQGAVMGVIDMTFYVAMSIAYPLYYQMSTSNSMFFIPFAICIICTVLFLMMHFYIYLLIVSTNLSLWKIIKNSFFLIAIVPKISVINLAVTAALLILTLILFPFSAFMLVVLPSFLGLLYALNCFPIIRKYVIQPWYEARGEEAPELSYADNDDGSEAVFKDTPETEVPVEQPKSSGKGKKIR